MKLGKHLVGNEIVWIVVYEYYFKSLHSQTDTTKYKVYQIVNNKNRVPIIGSSKDNRKLGICDYIVTLHNIYIFNTYIPNK